MKTLEENLNEIEKHKNNYDNNKKITLDVFNYIGAIDTRNLYINIKNKEFYNFDLCELTIKINYNINKFYGNIFYKSYPFGDESKESILASISVDPEGFILARINSGAEYRTNHNNKDFYEILEEIHFSLLSKSLRS